MAESSRDIVIIGGPNGAGKTTAASVLLPTKLNLGEFVNADVIARDLSPANPELVAVRAARLMIQRLEDLLESGRPFAFETTCSGLSHISFLSRASMLGWRITLLFLSLPSPEAAVERVARRVREGGQGVPPAIIVRRYRRGLTNLRQAYLPIAHIAAIYDNSDSGRRMIAEKSPEQGFIVHDLPLWSSMLGSS